MSPIELSWTAKKKCHRSRRLLPEPWRGHSDYRVHLRGKCWSGWSFPWLRPLQGVSGCVRILSHFLVNQSCWSRCPAAGAAINTAGRQRQGLARGVGCNRNTNWFLLGHIILQVLLDHIRMNKSAKSTSNTFSKGVRVPLICHMPTQLFE